MGRRRSVLRLAEDEFFPLGREESEEELWAKPFNGGGGKEE